MEHLQEYEELGAEDENAITEEIIADWKFFVVPYDLTRAILSLNERLGSEYFKMEYERLDPTEKLPGLNNMSRGEKNDEDIRQGIETAWTTLFHGEEHAPDFTQSEEEVTSSFQGFLSERIFNHFAMLSRSSYAKTGTYSIREEMTIEVAEKIGLGMYLHHKTPPNLRTETEDVLLRMAKEFQRWLIDERRGLFFATWGALCSRVNKRLLGDDFKNAVVMEPDVTDAEGIVDSNATASVCSEESIA